MDEGYDTMQVCINGHQITAFYQEHPENRKDFCDKCGKKTIHQCPKCNEDIRGYHHVRGVYSMMDVPIPSHCHACGNPFPWKKEDSSEPEETEYEINSEEILETIFERFPLVVKQLRIRYDNRATLDVQDEYDAQNLLHSLLTIDFDDIRPEEWNPSYAGSSTKSDFLLKDEKIILEVKHTRRGLTTKILKQELIIDKEQYKKNPDCETMYCFVYDPENRIENPRGFEKDFLEESDDFTCKVFIVS